MKHVTLRSSSATNAGSGQASGKHSQLSLFPICLCCHPQFLTQFLYVPQLQSSQRWTASELTCRLWSPYSMRRRYILFILCSFFFHLYFVFVFRSVCGFTDCREAFARLFSFCFIFFLCFLLRVKSLK